MKRPITFNFLEKSDEVGLEESLLYYDEELNLSIDKESGQPAFDVLNMDTSTGTKVHNEVSDPDNTLNPIYLDTLTRTNTEMESTDTDANYLGLAKLMDTSTFTESSEETDSDPQT
ncbi:MAG: hypothetical protein AAF634_02965 [Bacteroidota bacterium]|jgi:hypothetical protein